MFRKRGYFRPIGIIMVAALILSSCSASVTTAAPATQAVPPTPLNQSGSSSPAAATDTPAPTATPVPAATDTPAPVSTATLAAAPTVAATATTASSLTAQVVPTINPYCRKGPGYGYDAITFLLSGTAYNVIGRDSLSSWWQIQAPGNVNCWVVDANVTKLGPLEQVSVVQAPPLPGTPAQFVSSFKCDVSLKTFSVALNWAAVNYVANYRIYRNGDLLIEVGPTVTSYSDNGPLGQDLVYELQPFNDYGVAPRISTSVPACR
jgi:hypothetical protein